MNSENNAMDVVVIFSGGLDSTTLLWHLHSQGYRILEAMTFNYGQKHSKETVNAGAVLKKFQTSTKSSVKHNVVDISTTIGKLIATGALTGDEKVPHDVYSTESQKITNVPNRNMILLSIAVGRAATIGARYVSFAPHASNFAVYPDCRPEFIDQLDKAVYLGNLWTPVNLLTPFKLITKSDIVKLGLELEVPYEETWSCYQGEERPCLQCPTCLERTQAFLHNESKDPALTESEWDSAVEFYRKYAPTDELSFKPL